ncbi:MAG: hypothetical protein EKK41_04580 [Hyphomicrobiales bacterium]|nr:MAG: hypothetical protein EKK41_04580 [Hyphomicrobiales bacterium]
MGRSIVLLCAGALGLASSEAKAGDVDVIRGFGMLGVLALTCSEPPSTQNPYVTYAATADGKLTRTLKMKPDLDGTFSMWNLRMAGPDLLQYDEEGRGSGVTVSMARINGKFRSWRSVQTDGKVLIADGKFTSSGKETPAFEPCLGPRSASLH